MFIKIVSALAAVLVFTQPSGSGVEVKTLRPFPYQIPSTMMRGSDGNFYGYLGYDESDLIGTETPRDRVFQLTPDGGYRIVHYFEPNDGTPGVARFDSAPRGPLVAGPDGSLYGAVARGGANGYGALFHLTPDGTYEDVFSFTAQNSIIPYALGANGDFYGLSVDSNDTPSHYICKLSTQGVFTILHAFPAASYRDYDQGVKDASTAAAPRAPRSIILASDGTIYGFTLLGGEVYAAKRNGAIVGYFSYGTLFSLTPDGAFTVLQNGTYFHVAEASNGTLYGYGTSSTISQSGGGLPREIFSYTPLQGYRQVRLFNDSIGSLDDMILGSDGMLYGNGGFPYQNNPFGVYGGINIFSVDASGNQTVLKSFPNAPIEDGATTQTTIWYMLDGHDGYLYLIASSVIPHLNGEAREPAASAMAARGVSYTRQARVARIRTTANAANTLAAKVDWAVLPRAAVGVPVTASINVLNNDVITRGAKAVISKVSTPAHGTVEIVPATGNTRAKVRYTTTDPALQDTFTYEVTDESGAHAVGQVVVYGIGRGTYRGEVVSTLDATRVGSASLTVGSLGAFSGNIRLADQTLRIVSARFDGNNHWEKVYLKNGVTLATVTLTRAPDGTINGTVTAANLTAQFSATR